MQVVSEILALREQRRSWQLEGKQIAFVPTMGNLHDGHLQLVREAKQHADIVVVSIFVNPLQFGPDEDLRCLSTYNGAGYGVVGIARCRPAIYAQSRRHLFPSGLEQQTFVEVPGLSYMICGASRPGHFRGVATIVCKLFNMVQPNLAFFGEKDFQQLQVIKAMVTDLSMNLKIFGVPTMRESRWSCNELPQQLPDRTGANCTGTCFVSGVERTGR